MRLLVAAFVLMTIVLPTSIFANTKVTRITKSKIIKIFNKPVTDVTDPNTTRFSTGWAGNKYLGFRTNAIEMKWKFPKQKAIIQLSIGASKKKDGKDQILHGDLNLELAKALDLELPQSYEISSIIKNRIIFSQMSYMAYYSFWNKQWWKIPWDIYASTGIMGHFHLIQKQARYKIKIKIDEENKLEDGILNPLNFVSSNFHFAFPICINADLSILTTSICGIIHTDDIKSSNIQGSLAIGF